MFFPKGLTHVSASKLEIGYNSMLGRHFLFSPKDYSTNLKRNSLMSWKKSLWPIKISRFFPKGLHMVLAKTCQWFLFFFFFFSAKLVHKTLFEYTLHRKYAFLDYNNVPCLWSKNWIFPELLSMIVPKNCHFFHFVFLVEIVHKILFWVCPT